MSTLTRSNQEHTAMFWTEMMTYNSTTILTRRSLSFTLVVNSPTAFNVWVTSALTRAAPYGSLTIDSLLMNQTSSCTEETVNQCHPTHTHLATSMNKTRRLSCRDMFERRRMCPTRMTLCNCACMQTCALYTHTHTPATSQIQSVKTM